MPAKILIADDHEIVLEGIRTLVGESIRFDIDRMTATPGSFYRIYTKTRRSQSGGQGRDESVNRRASADGYCLVTWETSGP